MTEPYRSKRSPLHSAHSPFSFQKISRQVMIPIGTLTKKILRQPKYWVSTPPKNGPTVSPKYTEVM